MFNDTYRSFFEKLLATNCTTGSEYEIGELLADFHSNNNLSVQKQRIQASRNNIFAFDQSNHPKRILFTSHIDTVPPHLEFKHDEITDCYYGRGACDTKGGIIAQLIAGDELTKRGFTIDYLWVVGEETDHIGAKMAVDYYQKHLLNKYDYQMIILCEPTGMKLASAQKGILKAKLTFTGKMAHSGFPELGIDANHKLIEVGSLFYRKCAELIDTTYGSFDINIGILSGGQAANVVSGKSEFTFLARTNSNHQIFHDYVNTFKSDSLQIDWISDHPPIHFDYIDRDLLHDQYIAKFNTDVVFLRKIAPVYLIGPGDIIHAHSDNEHIYVNDIKAGAESYINLVNQVIS